MKRLALIFLVGATALPSGFARDNSLLARVTVYWARGGHGADRYSRQHKSATGTRLHVGHCAVDPKRIPYGSRVVLPDGTSLSAVDTGSAVRNRKAVRERESNSSKRAGSFQAEHHQFSTDRFGGGPAGNEHCKRRLSHCDDDCEQRGDDWPHWRDHQKSVRQTRPLTIACRSSSEDRHP